MAPTKALSSLNAPDPPAASNVAIGFNSQRPPHTSLVAWLIALALVLAVAASSVFDAPTDAARMLGPASEAPAFTLDAGVIGSHAR